MAPIVWPGKPYPLGATWDGEGVNFALFSEHAEKVELCLFDDAGRREISRIALTEQTDQVRGAVGGQQRGRIGQQLPALRSGRATGRGTAGAAAATRTGAGPVTGAAAGENQQREWRGNGS